ncbi:phosphatidylglycerophosphatase A [Pseudodesulfovibrio senegalensis]|jgi:phosphatidylglycerophosphatase A|uniref:Phosphatidylglycerophosphatase A n=1 Tax=Pseudodesulfovibrio senegalensis TaxID=1721087 RepID=A0A6N6NAJ5_9BACT|nr:phosphatidylglycerophosphatase A [Pseudodesulfovibrio senegalensis]KAB1443707.1 phosphatidylglycerophosphatase A [Pseudodesulfovibrio senegalensis]
MSITDRIAVNIATLGPIGHLPKMPGTWGSAASILVAPWLFMPFTTPFRLLILALLFVIGSWACTRAEIHFGRKDPGCVIVDELFGQWLAMLPFIWLSAWQLLAAFVLFRIFDIFKPWPVKKAETAFPKGFGVMIDDGVAGAYAALALWAVILFSRLYSA